MKLKSDITLQWLVSDNIFEGLLSSKLSFGKANRLFGGHKFRFTSMRKRNLRPQNQRFSSHNDNFQYNCPHSKVVFFFLIFL